MWTVHTLLRPASLFIYYHHLLMPLTKITLISSDNYTVIGEMYRHLLNQSTEGHVDCFQFHVIRNDALKEPHMFMFAYLSY